MHHSFTVTDVTAETIRDKLFPVLYFYSVYSQAGLQAFPTFLASHLVH